MKTIAVLHTARATVPMLTGMIRQAYPGVTVYNWLDDSILPMLMEDKTKIDYVFDKMLFYGKAAQDQGAAVILNACSSVGEFQDYAAERLKIPVVRIDDAVTDLLARQCRSVGVLATLETTLRPSAAILKRKNVSLDLSFQVVEGAWAAGLSGDKEGQNRLIAAAMEGFLKEKEAVFLAQASMAEAVGLLGEELRGRVYTSPGYAVESLEKYLV
jgi:Asp/Glu/hydantoin racemase